MPSGPANGIDQHIRIDDVHAALLAQPHLAKDLFVLELPGQLGRLLQAHEWNPSVVGPRPEWFSCGSPCSVANGLIQRLFERDSALLHESFQSGVVIGVKGY